jgi:hypothetical protein
MKHQVANLRLREMQLQILLILETISLESSAINVTTASPLVEDQSHQHPKKPKEKTTQDLNVALELLVDRLCIWHAVRPEENLPTETINGCEKSQPPGNRAENDTLRDFCIEVIIPFYAARLPQQCKTISRKLGVPNTVSSAGPIPSQSKKVPRTQPGAAIRRSESGKSRHTLQRVLTDEKPARRTRVSSLLRSNTFPTMPELKRESSEPALLSLITNVRGGIQKPKRIDNREVDLDAVAKHHESKLKKMSILLEQKKELEAAISALRKPNRELVAKDFADSADKRLFTINSRKAKRPVRNPLGHGVQVMATPKGVRRKDCGVVGLPALPREWDRLCDKPVTSPPSSSDIQIVPSSTTRPRSTCEREKIGPRRGDVSSVHETPSRPPFRVPNQSEALVDGKQNGHRVTETAANLFKIPRLPRTGPDVALSQALSNSCRQSKSLAQHNGSLLHADSSTIQETPPRPAATPSALEVKAANLSFAKNGAKSAILTTPIKIRNAASNSCAAISTAVNMTPEKSIYDHLGWDDEDDELALD